MTDKEQKGISKFLSFVLRHNPGTIGLNLDRNGWADTRELLEKMNSHSYGINLSLEELQKLVESNEKKRFAFSEDFSRIRANQGHSIEIDLALATKTPPDHLFHGTAEKNLDSIKESGLLKGQRHHVHLSSESKTALCVGQRHGKAIVLKVNAMQMHEKGIMFYQSENDVWLTDHVLPGFIEI